MQDRQAPLLDRHLLRLAAGGCEPDLLDAARAEATRGAASWPEPYGRMTLLVEPDGTVSSEVTGRPSTIVVPDGPIAVLVHTSTPELPPGAAKPADRGFWDEALHAAEAEGGHVAVLVAADGSLIDGSQATVWLRFGRTLATPPSPPALAGVSRGVVIDVAPALGYEVTEKRLSAADYARADEAFFTTAVAGAVSIRGREGAAAESLAAEFARLFGTL